MKVDANTKLRANFWELPLSTLNSAEWEALCDGCGRCCLKKFEESERDEPDRSNMIAWTRVICQYFEQETARCGCYSERTTRVPDCVDVRSLDVNATPWIPKSCAYKLRAANKPLYDWHPLISGSKQAIQEEGISVVGKVVSEEYIHPDGYFEHVIDWVE